MVGTTPGRSAAWPGAATRPASPVATASRTVSRASCPRRVSRTGPGRRATAEPATAEPATAEPATAEPATAEPATARRGAVEPTTRTAVSTIAASNSNRSSIERTYDGVPSTGVRVEWPCRDTPRRVVQMFETVGPRRYGQAHNDHVSPGTRQRRQAAQPRSAAAKPPAGQE